MKLISILLFSLLLASGAFASSAYSRREDRVQFTAGAEAVVVHGRLESDQGPNLYSMIDYLVSAHAGQTLVLTLKRTHWQTCFNVNAPGADLAMFVGSNDSTDSPAALTFRRREDVTIVKLGGGEWYAIPDAIVVGG